ncbi:hypothetical protein TS71_08580 [Mycolicibacterium neoaurum]|uniref:Uncharacterized protein n=1 Tax=Mycolicibacterium neoaurum VKM Ac-1815D TaxID=700508 RepID=V5X931_MYCNE|nr:hypothetical protein MyAD_10190 [Mycolicibacterium neoaurum]AXK76190.1 hypothetical protein DXK33_14850 [Mycolicibacterium neoaurum]KJQ50664.1 hypothetical protein TS71_08580 [Mycolicibacterium neoaurum]KUM09848.1 hypothetical protein AVZ31_03100 [Mycolicibacterium neoaurum]
MIGKPLTPEDRTVRENWMSWMAGKYRRSGVRNPRRFGDVDNADARRVRNELDAIRARFPDHA